MECDTVQSGRNFPTFRSALTYKTGKVYVFRKTSLFCLHSLTIQSTRGALDNATTAITLHLCSREGRQHDAGALSFCHELGSTPFSLVYCS